MATSRFDDSANVVTLNIFTLINVSSRLDCIHMQTNEVVHPLTAPGGSVYDPLTLLQEEHAVSLIYGRKCEYCDQPASGIMSVRHNNTPWISFADQIQGRTTLPIRSYFPFSLMSVGILVGPFAATGSDQVTDTTDSMKFSERLKTYGFYRPNQNCVVVPTCKNTSCNTEAKKTIQMFERQLGLSPELPWSAQPFTTALGNVVCQYCGDTNVKLCKKDGNFCGFGYCSKEHQVADWNNHKKACKYHRLSGEQSVPASDKRLIVNHTFVGDPLGKLTYFVYPENIDVRLLDTNSAYFQEHYQHFASGIERGRKVSIRGTCNEPAKCVICKSRPAIRATGFQSVPVTSKDEANSNKLKYYKAMLHLYSKAGAFPAETFEDVWKQFEKDRASTAQMASLLTPVCNQEMCGKATWMLHTSSVAKLIADSGENIDPSGMCLTTII